jgi:hypothetical protein
MLCIVTVDPKNRIPVMIIPERNIPFPYLSKNCLIALRFASLALIAKTIKNKMAPKATIYTR